MNTANARQQPWLHSAAFDGVFILAPALVITAVVILFAESWQQLEDVPPWLWVALIIGVDVSHVYSTLYRTYFDAAEFRQRRSLYTTIPWVALATSMVVYSLDPALFWRALAYLAVFHFVRQQYGFMMMYKRAEPRLGHWQHRIDQCLIYLAPVYPLVYWHTHTREFDWFVRGDFVEIPVTWLSHVFGIVYGLTLVVYLIKEWALYIRYRYFNIPRNGLILGTALSWYVGIVYFNNDIAFTATNVIAHGIPYMALIWLYRRNAGHHTQSGANFGRPRWPLFTPLFLLSIGVFAYAEETLWDGLVWREHLDVLTLSEWLPPLTDTTLLGIIVPLLAVPQITHYILDAFIWRLREANTPWKNILFQRNDVRLNKG